MPFQTNTFIRNQDFTRDRDLGPPDSTISAEKVDDELNNVRDGLTTAKTQAATAESKATTADGKADAAQAAVATHEARTDDPHQTAKAQVLALNTDLDTVVTPGLYWAPSPTSTASAGLDAGDYFVRVHVDPGNAAGDLVQWAQKTGSVYRRSRVGGTWRPTWAQVPVDSTGFSRGFLLRDTALTARDFLDTYSRAETDAAVSAAVPSGAVMPFAMSAAPTGWLKADGAAVSRSTYAALFAAIGTTFGTGDGTTTFNLPNLENEFVRGAHAGHPVGTKQSDELKSHRHLKAGAFGNAGSSFSDEGVWARVQTSTAATLYTDFTGGSETRPRNVALLYCIKT